MTQKTRRALLHVNLFTLLTIAFITLLLALRFFDNSRIATQSIYNAATDVLGSFVCAVLFYGCIGDRISETDKSAHWFVMLIYVLSISFFNNIWLWYLAGVPEYRTWSLVLNTTTKWLDFLLVFFFYSYVRAVLEFKGKLARIFNHAVNLLLIPAGLLIVLNMFFPICFRVDENGVFHKEALYWLLDLYLVFVAPMTTILLVRSDASRRQKMVSFTFIVIPILHYLATRGGHGYATQYGSVLVALILLYCVLFNDRSKKLTSTQTELQTAATIQESMIPHLFPPYPDRNEFDLYASMNAAKEVGGDFYDFFLIDDDHLCLIMADVSGKGVPACLFMMMSKTILQNCALLGKSAAEILELTNEALCTNNSVEMFVTVWLGILEISTGIIIAANAGHEYPALKKGERFELLKDVHGLVLGGLDGVKYREYTIQMEPGDKLFLYTDGVPEATDKEMKMFGTERMLASLNSTRDSSAEEILSRIGKDMKDFVKVEEQFDDVTMLCLEYKGPNRGETEEG